jgi:probable F420-dependent oxidoreductase
MKFGFVLENFGDGLSPNNLIKTAQMAEDYGISSLWATDHVLPPIKNPFAIYNRITEAVTTISFLAGLTKYINLGISTLVLPRRHPILAAKQLASLDFLTKGRIMVSFGAGLQREEFDFMGFTFSNRGKRFDECLDIIKNLWNGKKSYNGAFHRFTDASFDPLPHKARKIPIWIAGNSKVAFKRALKYGTGWHPTSMKPNDIAKIVETKEEKISKTDFTVAVRIHINEKSNLSQVIEEYEKNYSNYLLLKISGGKEVIKRAFIEISSFS